MDRRAGMLRQLSQFSMRKLGASRRNLRAAIADDPTLDRDLWVPAPKGIVDCKLHENNHAELGRVKFRYTGDTLDDALEYSRMSDKPILAIFQEIPGCPESIAFGETVLSHPLVIEAAESLFIPMIVNTSGTSPGDSKLTAKYQELRHHRTMVRILNEKGSDLVLELADNRCSIGNIAKAMRMALETKVIKVPSYLKILETEYMAEVVEDHGCVPRKKKKELAFRLSDTSEAELHFAELKGVIATETGQISRQNVVKVTYNSDVLECTAVVRQALFHHNVDAVYYGDEVNKMMIQSDFDKLDAAPDLANLEDHKFRSDTCQKKQFIQTSLFRYVPMTALQLTMVNFALSRQLDANAVLSPRQNAILEAVETKSPRRNAANVDVALAWKRLHLDGIFDWA